MNLKSFKHNDWLKIYEGRWSILTASHWCEQLTKEVKFNQKPFSSEAIILVSENRSSGYMRQKDRDALGNFLAKQLKTKQAAKNLAKRLENQAKNYLDFIKNHENTIATPKLYKEFWKRHLDYWHPHINVKYVVDYLNPEQIKRYLPLLQKARLVAEPVLNRTEDFIIGFTKLLGKESGYNHELLLCLTQAELSQYFKTNKLPSQNQLKKRNKNAALAGNKKGWEFFTGKSVKVIEKIVNVTKNNNELVGVVAFPGQVRGIARIIKNPKNGNNFKAGNILVTGATRPEFLPIMHKASAFITDAGGILSHAAITAREMKKPCIIGTKIATKVLKDGDIIEVDANKGIIKKIVK